MLNYLFGSNLQFNISKQSTYVRGIRHSDVRRIESISTKTSVVRKEWFRDMRTLVMRI